MHFNIKLRQRSNSFATCRYEGKILFNITKSCLKQSLLKLPDQRENEQCNSAYLEIRENDKGSERKCGYVREAGSIFGSGASKLKLTFSASKKEAWNDKGFWLEVIGTENFFLKLISDRNLYF